MVERGVCKLGCVPLYYLDLGVACLGASGNDNGVAIVVAIVHIVNFAVVVVVMVSSNQKFGKEWATCYRVLKLSSKFK